MSDDVYHIPALLPQTLEALDINPEGIYVDCTFGGGGHSRAIVERLAPSGHLYGFDQDEDAVARAIDDPRFTMVHGNFRFLSNFMRYYGVDKVDGILADLGVSSHHFDDADRGFTFREDTPLDMRMNRKSSLTAQTILNDYDADKLADTLYLYGELRQARRLAADIVKARANAPIATTMQLLDAIKPHINPRQQKKELAQVFQALRIEVNGELDALRQMLRQTVSVLRPGGRLAIITYHSLEDRIVKNFMRTGNDNGTIEKDFFGRTSCPFAATSKPIAADDDEVARNPRSRSARLRVATLDNPSDI